MSRLIFGGTRDWHLGNHLAQAAASAGLDLAEMDLAIADPATHRQEVNANHERLKAAGIGEFRLSSTVTNRFSDRIVSTHCAGD